MSPVLSSKIHGLGRCWIPSNWFIGSWVPKPQGCVCLKDVLSPLYSERNVISIWQVRSLHPLPPAMTLTDRVPCWEWGPWPGFTVTGLSTPSARPGICDLPLRPVEYKFSLGNSHCCSEKKWWVSLTCYQGGAQLAHRPQEGRRFGYCELKESGPPRPALG